MTIDLMAQKTVVHNFWRIPQSTFSLLQSTVQMESSRSSAQTMTTTCSNIVETFASIQFVEASEMTIDLLVQRTVVHYFLRIPQYTFRLLQSTVEMESSRSSSQTLTTTSFNIVETFAWIPHVVASDMRIDFLVQKAVVHNFLRIPQSTFPLLYSRVQMESSRSSTQTMTTTSSNIFKTFAWIPFVEASEMRIYFTGAKGCSSQFLRIPQSTFPMLYSRVQMESSHSSAQTMTTTSSNIVETFASIPFVEASEMRIDFLVQKAVLHNFLRILQSTFRLLHSRVQMESSRPSTKTMTTISFNIVEIFV